MKENESRTKWLHVRLTEAEHRKIQASFKKTTETRLSEYVRRMILGKPMIGAVRNQSLQDILAELMKLRSDLNGAANNFNQAVKRLHTLRESAPITTYLVTFMAHEKQLLRMVTEMRDYIRKTQEKWLQN